MLPFMIQYRIFLKRFISVIILGFFFLVPESCGYVEKKEIIKIPRDTTITKTNAFSDLFMDSLAVENFIDQHPDLNKHRVKFINFYNLRNYQYAWFTEKGILEQAPNLLNLVQTYSEDLKDSTLLDEDLKKVVEEIFESSAINSLNKNQILSTELLLTGQFFNFSESAFTGLNNWQIRNLKWYIPRKKLNLEESLLAIIEEADENIEEHFPINPKFIQLKDQLKKFYDLDHKYSFENISGGRRSIKLGDSSDIIPIIKERLVIFGDLPHASPGDIFDESLRQGVLSFQERMGLEQDGIMGKNFFRELNTPIKERIKTILINMERMRWLPSDYPETLLLVNIPDFKLNLFENNDLKWNMRAIIGEEIHKTVIFSANLKYIVFSPYWNIPPSIVRKEILPAVYRNKNYLSRNDMEIVRYEGGLPVIRQRPGPDNSLGLVKFLFPNRYNIYMHDTPFKSLFEFNKRTFSHGCIRLHEPKKLAEYLLKDDPEWTSTKIEEAMNQGKEQYYTLKKQVPVLVAYFTAFVDEKGRINFREDIYGHDALLAQTLF